MATEKESPLSFSAPRPLPFSPLRNRPIILTRFKSPIPVPPYHQRTIPQNTPVYFITHLWSTARPKLFQSLVQKPPARPAHSRVPWICPVCAGTSPRGATSPRDAPWARLGVDPLRFCSTPLPDFASPFPLRLFCAPSGPASRTKTTQTPSCPPLLSAFLPPWRFPLHKPRPPSPPRGPLCPGPPGERRNLSPPVPNVP